MSTAFGISGNATRVVTNTKRWSHSRHLKFSEILEERATGFPWHLVMRASQLVAISSHENPGAMPG